MQTDKEMRHQDLVQEWTDQFVKINGSRPELERFSGLVGRVVTVNWNNKAVVDFAASNTEHFAIGPAHRRDFIDANLLIREVLNRVN